MKERIKLLLFCLLVLTSVSACNSDRVFEAYQGMEMLRWSISDTVAFELKPGHLDSTVSLIGIRYNDTYEYHNLYVRYTLADSTGAPLTDSLINIDLFDSKTGKPLGSGFGNVFTKYDTLSLPRINKDRHIKLQFVQYMRKDKLEGIEAVGLKILKK